MESCESGLALYTVAVQVLYTVTDRVAELFPCAYLSPANLKQYTEEFAKILSERYDSMDICDIPSHTANSMNKIITSVNIVFICKINRVECNKYQTTWHCAWSNNVSIYFIV